ncbi:MAG: NADH-quinone oxidoreductase subunit NuoK [Planctomycetes bacterium]|jgi:NADH-quinone oxidoreductase subunit K|nr:NADH-quinone oxidoreductase subunit NuoK [Planctomycetota bacterium]
MEIQIAHYLVVAGILFAVGLTGVVVRRNAIVILMCLELMLNAANLALVAFSRVHRDMQGQVFVFFAITVAAAEAAVMLAIIIAVYRQRQTVNVDEMDLMQG